MTDRLRIICRSHRKPVIVAEFARTADGWTERAAYSAARRQQYNSVEDLDRADPLPPTEDGDDFDLGEFVKRVRPEPDRRATRRLHGDRLAMPSYLDPSDDGERWTHPLRCPRCGFGSPRRWENLTPVLDLIAANIDEPDIDLETFAKVARRYDTPGR